jgi:hypothetical protein
MKLSWADLKDAEPLCLPDGSRVIVRPIREEDADEFARAYERLSEQSRRLRFLSVAKCLSARTLRDLTCVDHDHRQRSLHTAPRPSW